MSNNGPPRVDPISPTSAYALAADQMRRAIFMGRYLPGEKFPPERQLSQQLDVSRATLREAVRTLAAEGLVKTLRGASGGVVVLDHSDPHHDADLQRRLRESAAEIDDALDLRAALECHSARLAAERRTKAALHRIERACIGAAEITRTDPSRTEVVQYARADTEFHQEIARSTKNALIVSAVEEARARMYLLLGQVFSAYSEHVNDFHEEIVEAIAEKDPDAASKAMLDHIEVSRRDTKDLAKFGPRRLG